jgi:hypothetical protein
MRYLILFENYKTNLLKHKGDKVNPTIVYHKSNPVFRKEIERDGLKVMKGDSYSCHSPEETEPPAIFGKTDDRYDSTYDDDVWLIDCSLIKNEWFRDRECDDSCVVTYDNIPRYAISLIYKGTGETL